jgi:hypothetical protein
VRYATRRRQEIAAHGDVRWCEACAERRNGTMHPVREMIETVPLVPVIPARIESSAPFVLGASTHATDCR